MAWHTDWTKQTGAELGASVVAVGSGLYRDDGPRRARMQENISRYESERLPTLDPQAYRETGRITTSNGSSVRWNLARSLVSTVTAKIAGGQQPKVAFVASNADWTTRRKGPKLDAFITGLWSTGQEPFADIWELGAFAFRDAVVCGLGAIKVWSDIDAGRVVHERVFPWELLVDPSDAKYGAPSNLFHVSSVPKATLIAIFPDQEQAIRDAKSGDAEDDTRYKSQVDLYMGRTVSDSVRCYEWWSLPLGTGSPGKHVLAIDGAILIEDKWTRDSFPFALIRWDRKFQGWHGTSLIDEVSAIDDEMNDVLARISRTVRLTSMGVCFVRSGSSVTGDLITNEDAIVMEFEGETPPVYASPSPFGQEHIQYLQLLKGAEYEMSGVNQMTATAQKQAGLDSGAAIRMVADLQSERMAIAWRAYQTMFVEIARHDIASVRELSEENKNFSVKWPGNGFLKSINWKSCDLKDELYTIQIASAPSIKGTPADRLQTAQEMFAAGMISQDSLMAVKAYYDLPGEMERASRQRNVIDRYIERWLDATDEEIETNVADDGQPLFVPPIRFMRLEDALVQVADAYLQAELDGAPDTIKELFLRWIELADGEIQKKLERLAALNKPPAQPTTPVTQPGPGMAVPMPAA